MNGERRTRARHPNTDYLRIVESFADKRTGFTFADGELPGGLEQGGELVFLHDWSISRVPIKAVDREAKTLTVAYPIGNQAEHYKIDHFEKHPRYFVEGHRSLLDAPGEWFWDDASGVLTYWPMAGESIDTIEATVPILTSLLVVRGTEVQPLMDVHFQNIAFEHCAWHLPVGGYSSGQATVHEVRDKSVQHNHIHHVMQRLSDGGGIYTLRRQPGTVLGHNRIHDVPLNAGRAESNGMFLDEGSDQITIVDNVIYRIDRSPLRFHRAEQITVENNTLVIANDDMPPLRFNNTQPEKIRQAGNRVVLDRDFDPAAATPKATDCGL